MRTILIIFLSLAVLCLAAIGTLYIFEVRTWDQSLDLLFKAEGAIIFLGVCTALISVLLRNKQ